MLVLAGKNNIAVNALEYVLEHYDKEVAVICNQTDDGQHGWQRSFKRTASDKGITELTLEDAYKNAKIFISLEFDKIIRPEKFKTQNIYNIHFSLLPKYKGMYTSIWPIINGENYSGVTLHKIDEGIDTGDIIDRYKFKISRNDRSQDLYKKYINASSHLFKKHFSGIASGTLNSKKQSSIKSTYYSKESLNFSEITVDLNQTAHTIKRQIYAYSFREYQLPIVFGKKIVETDIMKSRSFLKPGDIIKHENDYIEVATIDYDIRLYFDNIDRIKEFSNCTVNEAKFLLKNICGVNDKNKNGWSPIIIAAFNGNHNVVKYLLNNGADVNDTNYNGTSLIMYAKDHCLKVKDVSLFNFLVDSGANINHRDFYGKNLKDYLSITEQKFLGLL